MLLLVFLLFYRRNWLFVSSSGFWDAFILASRGLGVNGWLYCEEGGSPRLERREGGILVFLVCDYPAENP